MAPSPATHSEPASPPRATPRAHPSWRSCATVVDEFDAFDEAELLYVLVNYHRSPLGAWTAILVPGGLEPVALQATSAHDAFHKAMELIEVLSEHADVAISTMHTLDGDAAAW